MISKTFKAFNDALEAMINQIASFFDWCFQQMTSETGALGIMAGSFVVAQVALLGLIPPLLGAIALGLLAGTAMGKGYIQNKAQGIEHVTSNNDPIVETEIIPYDQWPDKCYVCHDDIPDDMEIRGQFVIHKGESESRTKAVPLCESCTWTHSTLVDNHDTLVEIYDERDEPTEL